MNYKDERAQKKMFLLIKDLLQRRQHVWKTIYTQWDNRPRVKKKKKQIQRKTSQNINWTKILLEARKAEMIQEEVVSMQQKNLWNAEEIGQEVKKKITEKSDHGASELSAVGKNWLGNLTLKLMI